MLVFQSRRFESQKKYSPNSAGVSLNGIALLLLNNTYTFILLQLRMEERIYSKNFTRVFVMVNLV